MALSWKDNNYYEILEVTRTASPQEIHEAFRRAKATYSQDNPALYGIFTKEEASELSRIVDEAYEVLGNRRLRENYDRQLELKLAREAGSSDDPNWNQFVIPEAKPSPWQSPKAEEIRWQDKLPSTEAEAIAQMAPIQEKKSSTPSGLTQFGNYEIKPETEQEIQSAEVCDGPFLQKVRLYKNVSLQDLSDATRISRTYLAALENMDVKALPAPVFVRGFVNQVARFLNLNEKKVVDSYMKVFREKTHAS